MIRCLTRPTTPSACRSPAGYKARRQICAHWPCGKQQTLHDIFRRHGAFRDIRQPGQSQAPAPLPPPPRDSVASHLTWYTTASARNRTTSGRHPLRALISVPSTSSSNHTLVCPDRCRSAHSCLIPLDSLRCNTGSNITRRQSIRSCPKITAGGIFVFTYGCGTLVEELESGQVPGWIVKDP